LIWVLTVFGETGLSEAHQALHLPCPCPGQEVLRRGDLPGQRLEGLESSYGLCVTAQRLFQHPPDVADRQGCRGLGFGPGAALGALDQRLGLIQPALGYQHGCPRPTGDAEGGVVGPAMPRG
jgi:hypothetical protein